MDMVSTTSFIHDSVKKSYAVPHSFLHNFVFMHLIPCIKRFEQLHGGISLTLK
jgi:hypothetical protein